jgi:hypothetical protein
MTPSIPIKNPGSSVLRACGNIVLSEPLHLLACFFLYHFVRYAEYHLSPVLDDAASVVCGSDYVYSINL